MNQTKQREEIETLREEVIMLRRERQDKRSAISTDRDAPDMVQVSQNAPKNYQEASSTDGGQSVTQEYMMEYIDTTIETLTTFRRQLRGQLGSDRTQLEM